MKLIHIDEIIDIEEGRTLDVSRYFDIHNPDSFGVFTVASDANGIGQVLCGTLVNHREDGQPLKLLLVAEDKGMAHLLRRRHKSVTAAQVADALNGLDGWLVVGLKAAKSQQKPAVEWPDVPTLWFGVVRKPCWERAGRPVVLDTTEKE